jgi:hypothetical protein
MDLALRCSCDRGLRCRCIPETALAARDPKEKSVPRISTAAVHRTADVRRSPPRLFLARLLLTLDACKTAAAGLIDSIGPLDQCVAIDHDALLAE